MNKPKNIGFEVIPPSKECSDKNCPFHGTVKVRGRIFTGKVIRSKSSKTIQIEFDRLFPLKKYERFEKRLTRIPAHNPECISAVLGDRVKIVECRPLSKTKSFVVIEK